MSNFWKTKFSPSLCLISEKIFIFNMIMLWCTKARKWKNFWMSPTYCGEPQERRKSWNLKFKIKEFLPLITKQIDCSEISFRINNSTLLKIQLQTIVVNQPNNQYIHTTSNILFNVWSETFTVYLCEPLFLFLNILYIYCILWFNILCKLIIKDNEIINYKVIISVRARNNNLQSSFLIWHHNLVWKYNKTLINPLRHTKMMTSH